MRRFIPVVLVLFVLCLPSTVRAQDVTYQIVEQRALTTDQGRIFAISPDGERLIAWRDLDDADETRLMCALDAETLEDIVCTPFDGQPGIESSSWSPDGIKIAFTEDPLRDLDESDLWVFDTVNGEVSNLTDDQYAGNWLRAPTGTPTDISPVWSPDGTEIAFVRSLETAEDVESTVLYRIDAAGGEPREIATVAETRLAVYTRLHWTTDGTIIYYLEIPDSPDNGLWQVPAEGGTPTRIVSQEDLGGTLAFLAEVSVQNQGLFFVAQDRQVKVKLVDFATGAIETVTPPGTDPSSITAIAFSPDGTRVLLANRPDRSADPATQLTIRSLETGEDQTLSGFDQRIGQVHYRGGLVWTTNNTIYGPSSGPTSFLLTLAPA